MKFYPRPVQLADKKSATGAAGAVTAHGQTFDITTESVTTAAGSTLTYTVTNRLIGVGSKVLLNVGYKGSTTGTPVITKSVVTENQVVISILNAHASAAFNGTLEILGFIINPGDTALT